MESEITAVFNISISNRSSNSVEINWEYDGKCDVFRIKRLVDQGSWKIVYWGRKTSVKIENLRSNSCHYFEIVALKQTPDLFLPITTEFFKAATIEEPQFKAFHRTLSKGQIKLVMEYVKENPEFMEIPYHGFTALGYAVNENDYYMTRALLECGANPDVAIPELKRSPLHISIFNGNLELSELLIKQKADIRLKDIFGSSIAHHAVDMDDTKTLMYCLEKGIHTETRDNYGNTLLLRAVITNASINLIKLLLDNKSNTTTKDKGNLSVLYHCRLKNNDELVELLFNYKPKSKTNAKQKMSQTIQRIIFTQKIKTDNNDDESDIDDTYDMFN